MRSPHQIPPVILAVLMFLACGCVSEVQGEAFDSQRMCWGGTKLFDYSGPSGCDDSVTYARDSRGGIWRFRNGCIGDDLQPANDFTDDGFPECPPAGVELVTMRQRDVDTESMCLHPWVDSLRQFPETDPCVSMGPELKRFSSGDVVLFSNHCQTSPTDPYDEFTAEEVMMWADCP